MILKKEFLTKSSKKGWTVAVSTLSDMTRTADKALEPVYTFQTGGSTKRPSHFCKVRFRVPQFVLKQQQQQQQQHEYDHWERDLTIAGAGRCTSKKSAKSLAALEVIHRLEEHLGLGRGELRKTVADYQAAHKENEDIVKEALVSGQALPDVSWAAVPVDRALSVALPANREGRISFLRDTNECAKAMLMAKAMTLACRGELPDVTMHGNFTDDGITQRFANIRSKSDLVKDANGSLGEESFGATYHETVQMALQSIYIKTLARNPHVVKDWAKKSNRLKKKRKAKKPKNKVTLQNLLDSYPLEDVNNVKTRVLLNAILDRQREDTESSFGMAKLMIQWRSKNQVQAIQKCLHKIDEKDKASEIYYWNNERRENKNKRVLTPDQTYHDNRLRKRIDILRRHQSTTPLPIDQLEEQVTRCDAADATILCGGTGSGKTTRYPLFVSLFANAINPQDPLRVVVVQPRRLACQAAAKRVAFEQGYDLETHATSSPIGYSVRFDSKPSSRQENRTVDFQTIGVVIATAANDPLLSNITHLFIDEVHERNADMDLLLSLAKKIQRQRKHHPTLPPLKIVVMSATLNSSQWEEYFGDGDVVVEKVSLPDTTRFPIDVIHYGDSKFPRLSKMKKTQRLADDELCKTTAELAATILKQGDLRDGSILCFLPGMEEIQMVQHQLSQALRNQKVAAKPNVLVLHSSVSSSRQAQVFNPGLKVILSTNIAETSVTIPDVKFIIDTGRERQSTMLEDNLLSKNATVVGSQLVTVDISQSAAKQRAGRAGRVGPGTCFRLYTQADHDKRPAFAQPEMLRMDLAQLVLHSFSLSDPQSGDPLGLIQGAPDPPPGYKLQQALASLIDQGLVAYEADFCDSNDSKEDNEPQSLNEENALLEQVETSGASEEEDTVHSIPQLTHLGKAVSRLPATPRIGRMLLLGLSLQAVEPALTIAALLSVPKVFSTSNQQSDVPSETCSDVMECVKSFQNYESLKSGTNKRNFDGGREYAQVSRVRRQLASALAEVVNAGDVDDNNFLGRWNRNGNRVGAQAALTCAATQHVAHLVDGKGGFATRDCAGTAQMHPSSVNFSHGRRAHWYVYNELRKTSRPYLHVTTAASPLEISLFSNGGPRSKLDEDLLLLSDILEWTHVVDQWIPVNVSVMKKDDFLRLKEVLNHDFLNEVSSNPMSYLENEEYATLLALVMSAVEEQRR